MLDYLTLSLALSLHLGMDGEYNELHPHIRYQDNKFISGAYYNSLNKISLYAGIRHEINNFGIEFTTTTGYDNIFSPYIRATQDVSEHTRFFITGAAENKSIGTIIGVELSIN
jgi:hypothetical protein